MKFSSYEIDILMGVVADNASVFERYKYFTITKEMIISNRRYNNHENLLNLVGYKARYKTNDDHKTEKHFVEYIFGIKNPNGPSTSIRTKMCLKDDWNHPKDVIIK